MECKAKYPITTACKNRAQIKLAAFSLHVFTGYRSAQTESLNPPDNIIYNTQSYVFSVGDFLDTSLSAVFFAVHIETSDHNTNSNSVGDEWPMLVSLIELTNLHGHKLTLEFQAQGHEKSLCIIMV